MKKILLFISVFALMASCQREIPMGDERTVEIRIMTGTGFRGSTRADEKLDEAIKTVDILVFDNSETPDNHDDAKFLYKQYAWKKSDGLYNAILKADTDLDVYFAINSKDLIDETTFTENQLFSSVKTNLKITTAVDLEDKGLPMWGYRHDVTISASATNNFGVIKVLRAVAAAEVTITATNFEFTGATVEYAADQGNLAYAVSNIKFATDDDEAAPAKDYKLLAPEVPTGTKTLSRVVADDVVNKVIVDEETEDVTETQQIVADQLFFYENDYEEGKADAIGSTYTKVIVAGKYDPTPNDETDNADLKETYYPLAFRDRNATSGTNQRVPVIRNTKFIFTIVNVNGDGYKTPEEAMTGEDNNMLYDVIPWDKWTDEGIVTLGSMWLSVAKSRNEDARANGLSKTAALYRNATSTDEITFSTNDDLENYTITLDGEIEDAEFQHTPELETGEEILLQVASEFYEVYLVKVSETTTGDETVTYGKLVFVALENYVDRDSSTRDTASLLNISSGKLEYDINVVQRNASPEDWIDGGDQGWIAEGNNQ